MNDYHINVFFSEDDGGYIADPSPTRRTTRTPPRSRVGDTRRMAMTVTAVAVEQSGPAIRAALTEHAPEDCAYFEAELRTALSRAADDFDLSVVETTMARWHALATMAANPLTATERAQVARAKTGDFTGLYTHDEHGNWIQL